MVFGSFRGGFNENSKYLFLYCNEHIRDKHSVWISENPQTVQHIRSKGLEAYSVTSLRGIWWALTSKYWFVNAYTSDILFCLAGGATVVNLWHGLPWKCIEFGIRRGELARRYSREDKWDVFYHPACFRRPDYLLTAGEMTTDIFADAFRVEKDCCLRYGYPRDLLLSQTRTAVRAFIEKYESADTVQLVDHLDGYDHVYIYMPTWRDSQRNLFATGMDLTALNEVMVEQNAILLLKPHPNTVLPQMESFSNLICMDRTADIYCILPFTDVLITDYSSVMFDYPLMPGKGMILYQYDYDEYIREREFNFPLEGNIIGHKVVSFPQLIEVIRSRDYALDEAERQAFLHRFWGESSEGNPNVCEQIINRVCGA